MRVHELAKELGVTSKELIADLQKLGAEVKTHMSLVDDSFVAKIKGKAKPASSAPVAPETSAKPEVKSKAAEVKKVVPVAPKAPEQPASTPVKSAAPVAPVKPVAAPTPVAPAKPTVATPKPDVVAPKAPEPKIVSQPATAVFEAPMIRCPITVGSFAAELNIKIPDLIKSLMGIGVFANVNQLLNEDIVFKLAAKLGIPIKKYEDETIEALQDDEDKDLAKDLLYRPPVVTMMGHVDHGKTSLLDAIRKTNVASREAGFITQHIGAYGVDIPGKGHVTFLDTPGHEAFTAMRARGANVTDVVVLVVAADDGIMPQTVEAADHAREAGCPIVVAINKTDLPAANVQRVMTGLQKIDLMPEAWGGKTICIEVSAKTGKGIDQLLEMLLLESEVLDLKSNPNRMASGTVIESHLSKGSGPVATVIVQRGTLKTGDIVVSGPFMGRVRALRNDLGKRVDQAGPSYAVEVSGFSGVPEAGEKFVVVPDEKTARKITDQRILEIREREMSGAHKHLSLEDLYHRISEGNFKELKLIIKADVQGSEEALSTSLEKIGTDKCQVRVIHHGVGGINESDIMLATASDAIIIGFHVKPDQKAAELAEKEGVDIRFYNIIYEVVEDIRKAMEGLLEPTLKEVGEGKIEIRKVFKVSKIGTIGGGMVIKGKVIRSNRIRVLRGQVVLHEGKLSSLKRFKDDVREVAQGYECGLSVEGFNDLQEGDIIESFRVDKIAGKL